MADCGGFPGWRSHHCSSHSQDVRGLWRADRWKMRGTTTEGNGDRNKSKKEHLKENRKKLWKSEQVELEELVFGHEEPLFVSACLLFPRIGSQTEHTVVPMVPMPLRKWAVHDAQNGGWGVESLLDLNWECFLSNLFFTWYKSLHSVFCPRRYMGSKCLTFSFLSALFSL